MLPAVDNYGMIACPNLIFSDLFKKSGYCQKVCTLSIWRPIENLELSQMAWLFIFILHIIQMLWLHNIGCIFNNKKLSIYIYIIVYELQAYIPHWISR